MNTRCLICSSYNNFSASRGSKLADLRCQCGGKLELMSSAEAMEIDITKTQVPDGVRSDAVSNKTVVYPWKNKSKKLFLYNNEKRIFVPFQP